MTEPTAPAAGGTARHLVGAGGFGLLLGVLGAVGWHVQRPAGAIFHIFGVSRPPTPQQVADWADMWRPFWWPAALGFPLVGLVIGLLAGLASTRPLLQDVVARRPETTVGALGLLVGGLAAVGWHWYPYCLHEPTPSLCSVGNQLSDRERDQLIDLVNRSGFGAQLSDRAAPWWTVIIGYPLAGLLLGVVAGVVSRRRRPRP